MINAEELIKYFSDTFEEERNFGMLERIAFIAKNGFGKFKGTPEEKYQAMRDAVQSVQDSKAASVLKKYYVSDLDDTYRAGVRVMKKKDGKLEQLGKEIKERPGVIIVPIPGVPTPLAPVINKIYRAVKNRKSGGDDNNTPNPPLLSAQND